jgi:DNA (cytosine-5)-methyltransferase 1
MTDERAMARVRDRGLLGQTLDYVDRLKPEMILCENVAGIQAEKYGGVWQHFMAGLKERGYIVGSDVVDAARYGVPQYRKRSIMIAVHRGAMTAEAIRGWEDETDIDLKVPTEDANARPTTVGQALAHFPPLRHGETYADLPNHRCSRLTDINVRRLQAVKPGEKNTVFDGTDLALDCHKKMRTSDKPGGFTDVYTRLDPAKASPTITTKCCSVSNGRYGHFDVSQTRGLSVREAAALQSFPDNYEFVGKSLIHTAKMVGNAVPPRLAEFFGRYMAEMTKSFSIAYEGFERRSLNPS